MVLTKPDNDRKRHLLQDAISSLKDKISNSHPDKVQSKALLEGILVNLEVIDEFLEEVVDFGKEESIDVVKVKDGLYYGVQSLFLGHNG